jgi:hypothetical protein
MEQVKLHAKLVLQVSIQIKVLVSLVQQVVQAVPAVNILAQVRTDVPIVPYGMINVLNVIAVAVLNVQADIRYLTDHV